MDKKAINKSDLMNQIIDKYNLNPAIAERIIKIILESMQHALSEKRRIEIRGFGSFELRYRKPRMARNPKTGEKVQTPGKYVIHFKPGKEMRDRVNASLQKNH
jgi:integration host factor subunit beta